MDFDFGDDNVGDLSNSTGSGIPLHQLPLVSIASLPPTPSRFRTIREALMHSPGGILAPGVSPPAERSADTPLSSSSTIEANPSQILWGPQRKTKKKFTMGEVKTFYESLSQFGTDFNLIAVQLGRSRRDVKTLYAREMKKRPNQVSTALMNRMDFDEKILQQKIRERRMKEDSTHRQLEKEEEDILREIAEENDAEEAESHPPSPTATGPISVEEEDAGESGGDVEPPLKRERLERAPSSNDEPPQEVEADRYLSDLFLSDADFIL